MFSHSYPLQGNLLLTKRSNFNSCLTGWSVAWDETGHLSAVSSMKETGSKVMGVNPPFSSELFQVTVWLAVLDGNILEPRISCITDHNCLNLLNCSSPPPSHHTPKKAYPAVCVLSVRLWFERISVAKMQHGWMLMRFVPDAGADLFFTGRKSHAGLCNAPC